MRTKMSSIHVTVLSAILVPFLSGCVPNHSQIKQSSETISTSLYQRQPQKFFVDPDRVDFRGAVTIPIEIDELGNIHIDAVINRTLQVRFTLDTGATFVTISNKTWKELKSKGGETMTEFFSARPSSAEIATGEVIETTNFLLDLLEVGEGRIQFFKVLASRTDDAEGSNLLGMSFLKELGEFTIDVNNAVLIARPTDTHRLVPRGEYFAATDQRMMAGIQHWDTIAKQEAEHISNRLKGNERPIFVEISPNSQFTDDQVSIPFQQVYPDLLTKHLLAMGRSISSSIDQLGELPPLTLNSKIMVGYHSDNWHELVVTTEISNQSEVLFSDSNIFYLYPQDGQNYGPVNEWKETLPTFKVVNCNSESDCS
jgi:hypothetical protein